LRRRKYHVFEGRLMSNHKRDRVTVTLKVQNDRSSSKSLIIEPWLTEYTLHAGKSLEVVLSGDPKYPLAIHVNDENITVYAFDSAGATMSVRDGEIEAEHLRWPR
jgi:hypothetical protein